MSAARLLVFAALAAFAAGHWATLVTAPPAGRVALAVAAIVGGAAAFAAAAGAAATTAALVAIGIEPRLLVPNGWSELGANLDHGLGGLEGKVDYPYGEANQWTRLAILAVGPLALGLAATLAFWPVAGSLRRGRMLAIAGLALPIALYATAVAVNPPSAPLGRGLVLLALVSGWLWLPAIRRRDALAAAAMVAAAAAIAVPAAAQLDRSDAWLDYRSWKLSGTSGTTYRWEHSYGPIDWPREGRRMLAVQSEEAHYWKTLVLDRFDGRAWVRSRHNPGGSLDISDAIDDGALPAGADPRWLRRFGVTIGNLDSDVVVGAGLPIRLQGVDGIAAEDGTTVVKGDPLRKGDAYRVTAYVPDPTAEAMRAAPEGYPPELAPYTRIELPAPPVNGIVTRPAGTVTVPLRGSTPADHEAARRIAGSPYARMQRLSRRLLDGQPTSYDAVRAIHDHLRSEYTYSELPPGRTYPLAGFLFEDRIGYCQQFSGAMALMLRMAGIPSRVVSGFAPGRRDRERGIFRVTDLDAHSWVEVYFNDIGWVAFDPTPAAAPASQRAPGLPTADVALSRLGGAIGSEQPDADRAGPGAAVGGRSSGPAPLALLALPGSALLALVLGGTLVAVRASRHRRLGPAIAARAQLAEVEIALERLGWPTSDGTTLLALEQRLPGPADRRPRATSDACGRPATRRAAAHRRASPSAARCAASWAQAVGRAADCGRWSRFPPAARADRLTTLEA